MLFNEICRFIKSIFLTSTLTKRSIFHFKIYSYVTNVTAGKLLFEIDKVLEKSNFSTTTKPFVNAMILLWPDGARYDYILLFLSNAGPICRKINLSIQYI